MTDMSIVKTAYWEQIHLGDTPKAALGLATAVYLRSNPHMPFSEARARVSRVLEKRRHRLDYFAKFWRGILRKSV
jgi:hypothetical protein